MKPLMKTLLMMLLAAVLLAACGDDTASNDATDSNDEATEAEETVEPDEEEAGNNGTDEATEDSEATEEDEDNNDSSGFVEDQQLSIGETGVYDSTIGTFEITLNAVTTEDEVEGESPANGLWVITEVTIENVSDEPVDASEPLISDPRLVDDLESGSGLLWIDGFEGEIGPGDSLTGEMVFDVSDSSSYFELVYGRHLDGISNEVRWKFDVDEIE